MAATRWAQVLLFGFGRHNEDNTVENIVGYQKVPPIDIHKYVY